jgi:hypothetical protein
MINLLELLPTKDSSRGQGGFLSFILNFTMWFYTLHFNFYILKLTYSQFERNEPNFTKNPNNTKKTRKTTCTDPAQVQLFTTFRLKNLLFCLTPVFCLLTTVFHNFSHIFTPGLPIYNT